MAVKIRGDNASLQSKEVNVTTLLDGRNAFLVDIGGATVDISGDILLFKDTANAGAAGTIYTDGESLTLATHKNWLGVGGYDSVNDTFQTFSVDSEGKQIISKSYTLSDGIGNVGALLSTPTGVNNDAPLAVMPMMYNGTTWDRLSGNATSGLDVSIYNSTVNAANTARSTATTVICVQPVDSLGNIIDATPKTIVGDVKSVTTAGVRVALGTTMAARQIYIKANITNTGNIYVGGVTVTSANGITLAAGDSITLNISDRATVYLDSDVSLEGVGYTLLN